MNAKSYGILGMDQDCLLLTKRTTGNGNMLHRAVIVAEGMQGTLMKIDNIEFVTRFSANCYDLFDSNHLGQLAIACQLTATKLKGQCQLFEILARFT